MVSSCHVFSIQVQKMNKRNAPKTVQSSIPCYVINLIRRPDRLSAFKKAIHQSGLEPKIVEAIDGKNLSTDQIKNYVSPWVFEHFSGEKLCGLAGCSLSHFKVWEMISKSLDKYHLIFEDDARPVNKVALKHLSSLWSNMPADAHLIWLNSPSDAPISLIQRIFRWSDRHLHASRLRRILISLGKEIRYRMIKPELLLCSTKYFHTAEAYIITPEAAQALICRFRHQFTVADNDLLNFSRQNGINTYRTTCPIFEQNKELSTDIHV